MLDKKKFLAWLKTPRIFCYRLIIRYTKKAPQVSTPTLVEVARKLGVVGTRCCKLPEAQRMGCAEDYVSLLKYNKLIMMNFCLWILTNLTFRSRSELTCV